MIQLATGFAESNDTGAEIVSPERRQGTSQMEEKKESRQKLRFKYVFDDDYNPVYANGAYGGVSPRGEIVINFYHERPALPRDTFQGLSVSGFPEGEEEVPDEVSRTLIRKVTAGVVMNYDTAKAVHEWLGRHLRRLEQARKETGNGGDR